MSALTSASLRAAVPRVAAALAENAEALTAADAKLGDGDLGVTLERAAGPLRELAPDLPEDLGQAFMACAQVFMRAASSSYGTLVATALMSAAKACKGETSVPWSRVESLLEGAIEAMMKRGRGELGQKTVLDALDAARAAVAQCDDSAAMIDAASRAVDDAIESFRPLACGLGRARMYADKSAGLDDPGMLALQVIVRALR